MPPSPHNLRLDSRPLYARAVDALYELLGTGVYEPGSSLPSEAALATHFGVSRSTIREALGQLEKDGLIIRRQGAGTFVAPRSSQLTGGLERLASFRSVVEAAGRTVQVVTRAVEVVPADAGLASVLQVAPGVELAQVEVVETVDGCQTAYLAGWIPCQQVDFARLAAAEGSLLEYLSEHPGLPIAYSRSAIYALEADAQLGERLGCPVGRAVLYLAETVFTDADAPIAYFRNYFTTDCFNFVITRRFVRTSGLIGRLFQEDSQHGTV